MSAALTVAVVSPYLPNSAVMSVSVTARVSAKSPVMPSVAMLARCVTRCPTSVAVAPVATTVASVALPKRAVVTASVIASSFSANSLRLVIPPAATFGVAPATAAS